MTEAEERRQGKRQEQRIGAFGVAAIALAALALAVVVVELAAGPFAPQQPVEETVADLVVGVKDAIVRRARGEEAPPPAPAPSDWDIDRILTTGSIAGAGVAMLLGIIALVRQEPRAPAYVGFTLGAGTLLVVWLQWMAFAILGVLLIVAILNLIGGDLSIG
ncbi:MAG: hypothetical protein AAFX08_10500 [Pseudomonadota bacterium]